MSLLPPAFKDPAFAPLGRPIHRLTVAQARKSADAIRRYAALEDFECENHGNADTGCLQEPCMPPTGKEVKEVLTKGNVGRLITDLGRRALAEGAISYSNKGSITFEQAREMLDADVAHMREVAGEARAARTTQWKAAGRAGQKLDANLAPPSPELTSALNAAQAALAEHLFGEAKKVKDPFEKAAAKLRAKDAERALQMKAKADGMLQAACDVLTWNDALTRKLLEADANRKPVPPSQATDEPAYLRGACRDKLAAMYGRDSALPKSILNLFGAAGLADIKAEYLPDLWVELNRLF